MKSKRSDRDRHRSLSLLSLQPYKIRTVEYSNQKRERERERKLRRERGERDSIHTADGPPMCQLRTQSGGTVSLSFSLSLWTFGFD